MCVIHVRPLIFHGIYSKNVNDFSVNAALYGPATVKRYRQSLIHMHVILFRFRENKIWILKCSNFMFDLANKSSDAKTLNTDVKLKK